MNDKFYSQIIDEEYLESVLGVRVYKLPLPLECSGDVLTEDKLDILLKLKGTENKMRDIL